MGKRLVRWFFLNLLFALTPLAASILIRLLAGRLSARDFQANVSELLFFSIMVSVTSLGDLEEVDKPAHRDVIFVGLKYFLYLSAVWSAILYGVFILDGLNTLNAPSFRPNLLMISVGGAILLFLITTAAQVLIAKLVEIPKEALVTLEGKP